MKECRESEDPHGNEKENATGLLVTLPQSEPKRFHACGVSSQLQYPKNPQQLDDLEDVAELADLSHGPEVFLCIYVLNVTEDFKDDLDEIRHD